MPAGWVSWSSYEQRVWRERVGRMGLEIGVPDLFAQLDAEDEGEQLQ